MHIYYIIHLCIEWIHFKKIFNAILHIIHICTSAETIIQFHLSFPFVAIYVIYILACDILPRNSECTVSSANGWNRTTLVLCVNMRLLRTFTLRYDNGNGLSNKLWDKSHSINLTHTVKIQYLHFRLHANYFPLPWKIPEDFLSKRSVFVNNLRHIYHIKHMSIQPFTMGMDWCENGRVMDVSIMFNFAHAAFLLCIKGRND